VEDAAVVDAGVVEDGVEVDDVDVVVGVKAVPSDWAMLIKLFNGLSSVLDCAETTVKEAASANSADDLAVSMIRYGLAQLLRSVRKMSPALSTLDHATTAQKKSSHRVRGGSQQRSD
jgi:hypothetical protein